MTVTRAEAAPPWRAALVRASRTTAVTQRATARGGSASSEQSTSTVAMALREPSRLRETARSSPWSDRAWTERRMESSASSSPSSSAARSVTTPGCSRWVI